LTRAVKIGNAPAGFMPATLTTHDETASGQKTNTFTLDCLTERIFEVKVDAEGSFVKLVPSVGG
jgi:hypothetical protein